MTVSIRLDPSVGPSSAVTMLKTAMMSCTQILRVPTAAATIQSLHAAAPQRQLQFFLIATEDGPRAQNEVFDRIFRHCMAAGIRLPPRVAPRDLADVPRLMLDRLPLFTMLSDDERVALAPKITRRIYCAGEVIVAQGWSPRHF